MKSTVAAQPQAKLQPPRPQLPPSSEEAEKAAEDAQLQRDLARIEERRKADKIGKLLGSNTYLIDAMVTQVLPRAELEARAIKDHKYIESLPRWRFSRFYLQEKIVVDLFLSERKMTESEIEKRRAWCRENGLRYGALGPNMNTIDLVPQLELEERHESPAVPRMRAKKTKEQTKKRKR